jgi:hypothetical protein
MDPREPYEAQRPGHHPNESRSDSPIDPPAWFYRHDGDEKGPVPFSSLRDLADGGQLAPADPVRLIDDAAWTRAGDVPGLFPGGEDDTTTTPHQGGMH